METRETGKTSDRPSLYKALRSAGCELDSHASDLYVKADDNSRRILKEYEVRGATLFRSHLDDKLWFDVPFMYQPFWDVVKERAKGGRG